MLAPWVIQHLPAHRVYVEPHCGAGSVLLRKPRSYAEVLNDLDGDVVTLLRVLRDDAQALFRALRRTPYARDEYEAAVGDLEGLPPVERARRVVVRAAMGFGTNTQSERKGFRAYTGKNRTGLPVHDFTNYPRAIASFTRRLRGVIIENRPALDVVAAHDGTETLFYCDPPYVHDTRAVIAQGHRGYRHEMTDADHEALAAQLRAVRGMVVLSGYHGALYDHLFGDWPRVEREARADGAAVRVEVLWFSPRTWEQVHDERAPLFSGSTERRVTP
jgi:DNA adenine methylase